MATTPSVEEVLLQSVKIRKSGGIPLPSKVKNQLPERKKPKYSNHERTGSWRQVRATVLFPFAFLAAETHSYQTLLPFVSDCQTTIFFFFKLISLTLPIAPLLFLPQPTGLAPTLLFLHSPSSPTPLLLLPCSPPPAAPRACPGHKQEHSLL